MCSLIRLICGLLHGRRMHSEIYEQVAGPLQAKVGYIDCLALAIKGCVLLNVCSHNTEASI